MQDYDAAEFAVKQVLDVTRQSMLVDVADDSALVVYALGKNPSKLKELAAIKNPLLFAKAVAVLEQKIKVAPRTKAKAPTDTPVKGTAASASSDARLEQLMAQADKTGDRTKVVAYLREQKKK